MISWKSFYTKGYSIKHLMLPNLRLSVDKKYINLCHTYRNTLRFHSSRCASLDQWPTNGEILSSSHPHILHSGEVMPGVTLQELHDRRQKLMDTLSPGSLVL